MRASLFLALLTLPAVADPSDDYINFIRQIDADDPGLHWDLWDIEATGAATSVEGVGDGGSDFELWSIHSPTGNYYALASQFVATFVPTAEVTIETGDPYPVVKRTRADKGFTAYIDVSGLIEPEDVESDTPVAAQMLLFEHVAYTYPDGADTLEGYTVTPSTVETLYITRNGYYPTSPGYLQYDVTNIPSTDITTVSGEEHISVTALADFGMPESEVAKTVVQVWPVASASISGLDSLQNYKSLPVITINLTDLYPDSLTWVEYYAVSDPSEVTALADTVFPWNAAVPTDRSQLFPDLDEIVTTHGQHVLQVIHETPWGQEILYSTTFTVDRKIEFRGTMTSK